MHRGDFPPRGRCQVAKHLNATLTFEDLSPGDEWESPARTVTESDVVAFAGLSGDFNPIHVDHHSARANAFGRPVAHGLLGAVDRQRPGLARAQGRHAGLPRHRGMEVPPADRASATPSASSPGSSRSSPGRGRRALVTWRRQLVNQDGVTVQEGTTRTLVRGRARVDRGRAKAARKLEARPDARPSPTPEGPLLMRYQTEIHVSDRPLRLPPAPLLLPRGEGEGDRHGRGRGALGRRAADRGTRPTARTSSGGTSSTKRSATGPDRPWSRLSLARPAASTRRRPGPGRRWPARSAAARRCWRRRSRRSLG